jgi:hypothetical protein
MKSLFAFVLALVSVAAVAQSSSPSNQTSFSLSAQAMSLSAKTGAIPATDIGGTFKVTSNLSLRSDNLIAANTTGYFGGMQYFLPSAKFLAKTNFDPAAFQFYVTASGGEVRTTGFQHPGFLAGGGINYDPTGSGHFTVNLIEVRAARLPYVSAGVVPLVSAGIKLGF